MIWSVLMASPNFHVLPFIQSPLEIFPWVCNFSFDGRGCRHRRRPQIDERFRTSHSSLKIPGLRGKADLSIPQNSLVETHAGSTSWRCDHCPRVDEDLKGPVFQCLGIDQARTGSDDHPDPGMNGLPFQDLGRRMKIFKPAIAGRPKKDLVNLNLSDLIDRLRIVNLMRTGDHRFEILRIDSY